jgi:hypothetical protein
MFVPGSSYYLKSVFQSGPRPEITKSVFKKLSELNAVPGNEIQHGYVFEYMPRRVALTVPDDSTAFLYTSRSRGLTGAALKWNRNIPGVDDAAKRAARELTNIVAEAEAQVSGESDNSGYGNFSQCLFILFSES